MQFLATGDELSDADRTALLGQVHTERAADKRHCTDCHTADAGLLDFAKLGYPASRVDALTRPLLMQAIEKIMGGEPLHLPGFVAPGEEAANP